MKSWNTHELLTFLEERIEYLKKERRESFNSRDFNDYTSEIRAVKDIKDIIEVRADAD